MNQQFHARKTIAILAFTQVASWGSLYYAISILAPEILKEMRWSAEIVFGAFSWSLLVAGLVSTPIGILLDRHGGRLVMGSGSLVCAIGMIILSLNHSMAIYFLAWSLLGLGMALTLYEAAFATINRSFLTNSRQAISTLTLFGGFASTVFWPLTLKLNSLIGWRDTYLLYGLVQLAVCFPLHMMLGSPKSGEALASVQSKSLPVKRSHTLAEALRHPAFWKLALAFSANSFVFSTMSVHLIPLLGKFGHATTWVVMMTAMIGPMQVAGRLGEMTFARHALPQTVGKCIFAALPVALLVLITFGTQQWAVALFCILYGLSNGILTIVRGTIPQALFGRENYGAISGALAGPALISKAAGPLAMAVVAQQTATPYPFLLILLLFTIVSLGFYLAAIRLEPVSMEAI
ncbi:MFS transporter [Undibacterium sp. CY18W]|uniref:MFS transporter n=1 Tax=Undibacterium hunanense TaxID=2762292 RepID=A0ABR6ZTP4_9BURK|nr:MFS transporter [Undibacterium hunanense]MBC3919222.1 MFS transporter [Undibacterium hunanense]